MNICNEPFVVLYVIIPFIIRKDLGASLIQLSVLSSLRPVMSLFSFYWSSNLTHQSYRLRSNLIGAWLFARLPFLFVPWINNTWYVLFCCACYELLNRSGNPALIELLKLNLPQQPRDRFYNFCFVLSFIESILLGIIVAALPLCKDWQILFGITALISLSSIIAQMQIPVPTKSEQFFVNSESLIGKMLRPWKDAFILLKSKPEFFRFQCGFMLGGTGLMLVSPSLSLFYVDLLQLTHSEITIGRSILMGIGVTLSSYFWRKLISKQLIEPLLRYILLGFSMYLFFLCLSNIYLVCFYFSFILYGVSQAGSHLLWNLSGPLFSGDEDSSQFSRVNILMVGLRGAVAPAIGGLLCNYLGPIPVIIIGAIFCLTGSFYMMIPRKVIPTQI